MNTMHGSLPKQRVIGVDISVGSFLDHISAFADLGATHRSSYVCCVNAHMTVECHKDASFAKVVNEADLATADGMPVLRSMQFFHRNGQERVAGNDILPALMQEAERVGLSIYLYGGTEAIQQQVRERAQRDFPDLRFAGGHAPPFGPVEALDLAAEADRINATKPNIVMVSLGCPKQERWMAAMRGRIPAVMLGLGGAFLLYAGVDRRAPKWMRDLSLEWLYRLWLEPGRLWKRYLVTNTVFLGLLIGELFRKPFAKGTE